MVALLLLIIPSLVAAQLTLPILPSPTWDLIPGDTLIQQQLSSWGVSLSLVLDDLSLNKRDLPPCDDPKMAELHRLMNLYGIHKRDDRRSRAHLYPRGIFDLLGFTTGLNLGGASDDIDVSSSEDAGWGDDDYPARGSQGDTEWYTFITIGNPPQSLPVLPDTGSSDLFLFGPTCSTCDLSNHTAYSPASTSFQNLSSPWSLSYADGSFVDGYTAVDGLPFAVATFVSGDTFSQASRSGILGLAQDRLATLPISQEEKAKGSTMFSRMVKAGLLQENILSIRLEKGAKAEGETIREGGGMFSFGQVEEEYIVGGRAGLHWMPVVSTSLIITSTSASTLVHSTIPGATQDQTSGIYYVPCATAFPLSPNVFFEMGGRKFGVPVKDLAWKKSSIKPGLCVSGIQGGMSSFTVLGDMFIKNQYIVLSYGSEKEDNLQVAIGQRTDVAPVL